MTSDSVKEVAALVKHRTKASSSVWAMALNLEAAFDSCDPSPEALRECVLALRRSARRALDAELRRRLAERGHDAGDSCAPELSTTIRDLNLAELLEMIDRRRKDAIIDVFQGSWQGRMWCAGGEVIDASSGVLKGELALHRLLGMSAGEIVVDFRPVRRARTVTSSTRRLTAVTLRRKDECAQLEKKLGETDRIIEELTKEGATTEVVAVEGARPVLVAGAASDTEVAVAPPENVQAMEAAGTPDAGGRAATNDPSSPRVALRREAYLWIRGTHWLRALIGVAALALIGGAVSWLVQREAEPELGIQVVQALPPDAIRNAAPAPLEPPRVEIIPIQPPRDEGPTPPERASSAGADATPSPPAPDAQSPAPQTAPAREKSEPAPRVGRQVSASRAREKPARSASTSHRPRAGAQSRPSPAVRPREKAPRGEARNRWSRLREHAAGLAQPTRR